MLIRFKSTVGSDLVMFDEGAYRLLDILGKTRAAEGAITVTQMSDAVSMLKQAVLDSRSEEPTDQNDAERDEPDHFEIDDDEDEDDGKEDREPSISLAQRAQPLIELLQRAQKANTPVTWGP